MKSPSPLPSLAQKNDVNDEQTRPPKGDINSTWQHDMFPNASQSNSNSNPKSLVARLGQPASAAPPKLNFGPADKALKDALGVKSPGSLQIKGASNRGNVVDVAGLVAGTSAADVEVRSFLLVLLVGGKC